MYANLQVTGPDGRVRFAHRVEVREGKVFVHLDAQDGSGKYAEPVGVVPLDADDVTIQASF